MWDTNNLVSSSFQILLKFHSSFHTSYHGEDYKVRFNFNRTPLRRCHFALDYTMKQVGSDILFPSRLRLQLPQVCYIDPEAQSLIKNWRNCPSKSHQSSLEAKDLVLKKFNNGVVTGDTKELPGKVLGNASKSKSCYVIPVLPFSSARKKSKLYFFLNTVVFHLTISIICYPNSRVATKFTHRVIIPQKTLIVGDYSCIWHVFPQETLQLFLMYLSLKSLSPSHILPALLYGCETRTVITSGFNRQIDIFHNKCLSRVKGYH